MITGLIVVAIPQFWRRWSQAVQACAAPEERAAVRPAGDASDQVYGPTPALRIGILGTLIINDRPGALAPAQSQLIVALALRGARGMSNPQLCGLLGADPEHPRPTDSLRQLIVRTRRQLGRACDGRQWIEHRGHGVYTLHPSATLDWAEFDLQTTAGIQARDAAALTEALAKVRGKPFAGCYYWWIDSAQIETVTSRIVRAATTLAEIELDGGRPTIAARAARTGLAADPPAEQLWRLLMRAEYAAGNLAGVREAWGRCQTVVAEIAANGLPEPATAALYAELLAR
jgi:DNA-binding SARP family transcriptional activator